MLRFRSMALLIAALFLQPAPARAQNPIADKPKPAIPEKPATPAERDRAEAKKAFTRAALQYRQDRYLEAIRSLEECLRLDPEAGSPRKLLTTLYRIVGRTDDALASARRLTEILPHQFDGWQRYADLLKESGRPNDAATALRSATHCADLAEQASQQAQLLLRLCGWFENLRDADGVLDSSQRFLAVLDKNRTAFQNSGFLSADEFVAETADGWERIGRAQLWKKDPTAARNAFAAAQKLYADRSDAVAQARRMRVHWCLAEVEQAEQRPVQAIGHLREYLASKPRDLAPYRLWITLHDQLDRSSEKLRGLEAFARADKNNLPLQLLLAEQYSAAGDFLQAQDFFLRLERDYPKAEIYKGLFRLYHKHQRMDQALQKLDDYLKVAADKEKSEEIREKANRHARAIYAALRDQPAMIRALLPLAQAEQINQVRARQNFEYRTFEILANLAARAGELEESERLLRESLNAVRTRFQVAAIHEALIQVLLAQRKFRAVVDICNEGLSSREDNQFMYNYYMAFPLANLGETDKALGAVDQAIVDAHSDGAKLAAKLKKLDILSWSGANSKAVTEAEAMLKEYSRPDQTRQVRLKLATVYSLAREPAKAERELRLLLERDPNDARVCNDLGYQLADQNRHLDEAERLIRRAIALERAEAQRGKTDEDDDDVTPDSDNAAYTDSLGWVLFRRGKYAEARQLLEKAASMRDGREDPNVWDHLADVYFRISENDKARAAWQAALKFYREERRSRQDGRVEEVERKLKLVSGP